MVRKIKVKEVESTDRKPKHNQHDPLSDLPDPESLQYPWSTDLHEPASLVYPGSPSQDNKVYPSQPFYPAQYHSYQTPGNIDTPHTFPPHPPYTHSPLSLFTNPQHSPQQSVGETSPSKTVTRERNVIQNPPADDTAVREPVRLQGARWFPFPGFRTFRRDSWNLLQSETGRKIFSF